MNDVDVFERAALDDEHAALHPREWLLQFHDGTIWYFDTEDEACAFQRQWRAETGMDPMTGELT